MVNGNIEGIKKVYINRLEELLNLEYDKNVLVSMELLEVISYISYEINKEISVYINRRGRIIDIAVGDASTVKLINMNEKRSEEGLNGIRCIHTHPSGASNLSSLDITALVNMKFDCMTAIGIYDGKPISFSIGYLKSNDGKIKDDVVLEGPYPIKAISGVNIFRIIEEIEEGIYDTTHDVLDSKKERVILIGSASRDLYSPEESLDELSELAQTAGAEVIERIVQRKNKIDKAYYIGSGKALEVSGIRQSLMADTVIFDDELTGAQVRNLENVIGCKVIDRTTLILDIFAQRAKSREGKIQVELAQLKYRLPRLIGLGGQLSRTGGGIGTRGPGEKKIEIDKRHIRNRILDLERELLEIKRVRAIQREKRRANEIPVISLVGYTNSGKSTLRNKLCELSGVEKEKVLEADMLFATLDTTTRLIALKSKKSVLISDTVGFIRKLPHDLVEAFKSTLEEIQYSDLLIHLVDASNKNALLQIETVNKVLREIGVEDKESLLVLNKIDKADEVDISVLRSNFGECIEISAKDGINLGELLEKIESRVFRSLIEAELLIPYDCGNVVSYLHECNCVEKEEYRNDGIYLKIRAQEDVFGRVKGYSTDID